LVSPSVSDSHALHEVSSSGISCGSNGMVVDLCLFQPEHEPCPWKSRKAKKTDPARIEWTSS